jgi:hypothetical protein
VEAGAISVLVVVELEFMFFGSLLMEADELCEVVTWVWSSAQPARARRLIAASSVGSRFFMPGSLLRGLDFQALFYSADVGTG